MHECCYCDTIISLWRINILNLILIIYCLFIFIETIKYIYAPLNLRDVISWYTHVAAASVLAGVAVTLVGFQLTVGASEARSAGAGVAALTCVGAGCTIGAGLVIGAVVEVLVTEEPPPALLTVTLPWLAACPVEAAWVAHTFVAGGALPAHTTRTAPWGLTVAVSLTAVRRADGWEEREREGV